MEQIIFLHNDESAWHVLRRLQQSTAQHLVLIIPPHLERLRLNMVLRLIRRQTAGQSQRLVVVSEDRLVQVLAERMGCIVAATLDEYHGLLPGHVASLTKGARRPRAASKARRLHQDVIGSPEGKKAQAAPPIPSGDSLKTHPEPSATGRSSLVQTGPSEQPIQGENKKPSANLDSMLVDGYLPNPGATPGLDEAEELASQEADWLSYEVVDESHPDQAQRESEAHEARIIARIRTTSAMEPESTPPAATMPQAGAPEASAETSPGAEAAPEQGVRLRPMRSIDELIHERGRADLFEWLATQAAGSSLVKPDSDSQAQTPTPGADAASNASNREQTRPQGQPSPPGQRPFTRLIVTRTQFRQRKQRLPDQRTPQFREDNHPAWSAARLMRRIGVVFILALSLTMACFGLALLPSAEVSYHVAVEPYSETLTLDAQPATNSRPGAAQTGTFFPAAVAQFDGVLVAQASATGHQPTTEGGSQPLVPTQSDVDRAASLLRERLKALGQAALLTQIHPGDIAGPVVATEQIVALPAVGTPLPDGTSAFQVSLALHLRQVVARQQTLQQAVWNRMNRDVAQYKHGFTLASGQKLALNVASGASPVTGTNLPALHLFIQADGMIVPALTPDQARAAITGMPVDSAQRYLSQQAGISNISIVILPKWLNRLPIFAVRIRIKLES
ncbi:MAG TPA: hypothetical protein VFU32_10185 [Ktedonobacterales bacterium]|nr:hypothetical protein [Ktedonobacterales bacterium]